jgi:hypothetical protein
MITLKARLERGEALLALIDRLRQESGDANLGANIESMLIDQVIRDRHFLGACIRSLGSIAHGGAL